MNKLTLLTLAIFSVYFLLVTCTEETTPAGNDETTIKKEDYMPFPKGYGYPMSEDSINHWVAVNDVPPIREHAWSLWAGLNQTNEEGLKVWQSWHNLNQMFDGLNGGQPPGDPTTPSEADSLTKAYGLAPFYPSSLDCGTNKEGRFINTVDALLLFTIYYNQAAHDWITSKKLNKTATLNRMLGEGRKEIPQAPSEAMLLKQIYYPVKAGDDRYAALPVWDGPGDRDPLVYNGYETWERAVAITSNPNPPETVEVEYLYGMINRDSFNYSFPAAKTVSVEQFYYLKLDAKTLASFSAGDSCIVNATFNFVHNEDFEEGDYLVTIAMHILSKEITDWTMQTIWWHDRPNDGPYAADRPTDIPAGKWEKYLMTQAYYMAVPNEAGGEPHVAYNPYIELMVPEENRTQSNCQSCHRRAGTPIMPGVFVHPIGAPPPKYEPGTNYNLLEEGYISMNDTLFNGVLLTDFNWAIPINAD